MYPQNSYPFGLRCLFVFFLFEEVAIAKANYLGCYHDQGGNRLLAEYRESSNQLTPTSCVDVCLNLGYSFAGAEWGSECFCGYNRPPHIAKTPESECSKSCSGNPIEKCGGANRISVYTTGLPAVGALPSGFYQGCFKENVGSVVTPSERLLPELRQDFDNLTPKICSEFCFKKGFKFAGMQYRKECYCSNKKLDMAKKTALGECKMPCSGDSSKHCGGGFRLSVYATGLTDVPSDGRHVGCYEDKPTINGEYMRVLSDFKVDLETTNSPRTCMNLCAQMGFNYAGVQYGYECFCGIHGPNQSKIKPDSGCFKPCPGNPTDTCGGNWRLQVYKTPVADEMEVRPDRPAIPSKIDVGTSPPTQTESNCPQSTTYVNGRRPCKNTIIFYDDFKKLDLSRWRHEIKIASKPDYEFTVFGGKSKNIFTKNGALHIEPTVFADDFVENGKLQLEGCTGDAFNDECSRNTDIVILPPTESARVTTKEKFSFKYGIVEIQAKLPIGDWIVPEIWLMPADNAYGAYYESGKIRFLARGNPNLKSKNQKEIGHQTLEGSVSLGYGQNVKTKSVYYSNPKGWRDHFHNFTIIWTPDDISFLVDGKKKQNIMQNAYGQRLSDILGLPSSEIKVWNAGTPIAPFDQPFYISIGLSVGGIRDFENESVSNGRPKPWTNTDPRAFIKFWSHKDDWLPTWRSEDTSLVIKSIKVTAL